MRDIETANKKAQQRIDNLRSAADMATKITKVIEQFDGKVYNCRFDKALKEAVGNRIRTEKRYTLLAIYTWPDTSYDSITIATLDISDMQDGKRINAEKLIESTRKYREDLLRKAYEIETGMTFAPQIQDYIRQSIDKLNKYLDTIPSDIRDIYGLPWSVRTN